MTGHHLGLVAFHRVEGKGPEEGLDLGVRDGSGIAGIVYLQGIAHVKVTPLAARVGRIRLRPARIRLFTVPSGSPSIAATSL